MDEDALTVSKETIVSFTQPNFIKSVNHYITTEEWESFEDRDTSAEEKGDHKPEFLGGDEEVIGLSKVELAKEDDYFNVVSEGVLGGLANRLRYEYDSNEINLMEAVCFTIEHLCQRQAFGNGNKRTSFVMGHVISVGGQLELHLSKDQTEDIAIHVPELDEDLIKLISNVAVEKKDEDKEDLKAYFDGLREAILRTQRE